MRTRTMSGPLSKPITPSFASSAISAVFSRTTTRLITRFSSGLLLAMVPILILRCQLRRETCICWFVRVMITSKLSQFLNVWKRALLTRCFPPHCVVPREAFAKIVGTVSTAFFWATPTERAVRSLLLRALRAMQRLIRIQALRSVSLDEVRPARCSASPTSPLRRTAMRRLLLLSSRRRRPSRRLPTQLATMVSSTPVRSSRTSSPVRTMTILTVVRLLASCSAV
mmetsp:Transcript_25375/g.63629  ORF Transcript_25375/g.63629 Transcript_25375/m.63629 type:complete len:226 (+) Transcript_25375:461-1138(+)